jgi:hypothetical protein
MTVDRVLTMVLPKSKTGVIRLLVLATIVPSASIM